MKGAPPGRSFDAVVKRCTVCGERLVSKYSNTRRKREKKKGGSPFAERENVDPKRRDPQC